jgi:hypothetical protein
MTEHEIDMAEEGIFRDPCKLRIGPVVVLSSELEEVGNGAACSSAGAAIKPFCCSCARS